MEGHHPWGNFGYHASVNATSGVLVTSSTTGAAGTGGGGGGGGKSAITSTLILPLTLVESNNSNTTTPMFWNHGTFASSEATQMTLGDFTPMIVMNGTTTAVSTTGITLDFWNETGISGHSDGSYDWSTNVWSSTAAFVGKILNHDFFVVTSSASLKGESLVLTCTSSAPLTGSVTGAFAQY